MELRSVYARPRRFRLLRCDRPLVAAVSLLLAALLALYAPAILAIDSDNDGIPDNAESSIGLNPNDPSDALLDLDSDTWRNLDEYQLGTGINDASDTPLPHFNPLQEFRNEQTVSGELLGTSVSIHGDFALIGTNKSAYVVRFDSGKWYFHQRLSGVDVGSGFSSFGAAVAIGETWLAIKVTPTHSPRNMVVVYRLQDSTWLYETSLSASDEANFDDFGHSLAIDNNSLVVSSPNDDDGGSGTGSIYVFKYNGLSWVEEAKLVASDGASGDNLGRGSLTLDGDTAVAGSNIHDGAFTSTGAAYVYERTGSTWTEVAKLEPPSPEVENRFATSLSLDDDRLLIGAIGSNGGVYYGGSAYLYRRAAGNWTFEAQFSPIDLAELDRFGTDVALDGDNIAIGTLVGYAYLFVLDNGSWIFRRKVTPLETVDKGGFGNPISLSNDAIIFGANQALGGGLSYFLDLDVDEDIDDDGVLNFHDVDMDGDQIPNTIETAVGLNRFEQTDALLDLDNDAWINIDEYWIGSKIDDALSNPVSNVNEPTKFFSQDTQSGDQFVSSSSLSYTQILVGVPNAIHNGVQSGAAYLFGFTGEYWEQLFKFAPHDGNDGDGFGMSVSFNNGINSNGRIIIGAPYADLIFTDQGAAYYFFGRNDDWSYVSKLEAGDPSEGAHFGNSVVLNSPFTMVGAPNDDELGTDAGAVYAFELETGIFVERDKFLAEDGTAGDQFGASVALWGGGSGGYRAAFGAPSDDIDGVESGSVYLFSGLGPTLSQRVKLTPDDAAPNKRFGERVSLFGEVLAIGVPGDDELGEDAGAVYMYRHRLSSADPQGKLIPNDIMAGDRFGDSVAVHFKRLFAGAPRSSPNGAQGIGSAYIYNNVNLLDGPGWRFGKKLVPHDGILDDHFGTAVAILPDYLLAFSPGDGDIDTEAGMGYAFILDTDGDGLQDLNDPDIDNDGIPNELEFGDGSDELYAEDADHDSDGDGWSNFDEFATGSHHLDEASVPTDFIEPGHRLFASDAGPGHRFGSAVAIDGDTAVVAAGCGPHGFVSCLGSLHIFERNGTRWLETQQIIPPKTDHPANNLISVALANGLLILGVPGVISSEGDDIGAAYVYTKIGGEWTLQAELSASDSVDNGRFGRRVATDGATIVISSVQAANNPTQDGAVYVFENDGSGWAQVTQLIATDSSFNDQFGHSLAIGGNHLMVGAHQNDGAALGSGSVYVYSKQFGAWGNETKLSPASLQIGDRFGFDIAVEDSRLVVGAPGIGNDKGGVYVFSKYEDNTWAETPFLLPPDVVDREEFGNVVEISERYIVVGAGQTCCTSDKERAYVFLNEPDDFQEHTQLFALQQSSFDHFPSDIAISGQNILIGEMHNGEIEVNAGMAYVFDLDIDDDLLFNKVEAALGTNPFAVDSDEDGLSDYDEVNRDGNPNEYLVGSDTDPINPDTDGDGLLDGEDPFPLWPVHPKQIPAISVVAYLVLTAIVLIAVGREFRIRRP